MNIFEPVRTFRSFADVTRLGRSIEAAFSKPIQLRWSPETSGSRKLRPGELLLVQVADSTDRIDLVLPTAAESQPGHEVAWTHRGKNGVIYALDPATGERIAATTAAGHSALLRYATDSERWVPVVGGLYWQDLQGTVTGGTTPFRAGTFEIAAFADATTDRVSKVYQMPHGWARTPVRVHLHCTPLANATGNIRHEYAYAWAGIGDTIPAPAAWSVVAWSQSLSATDRFDHLVTDGGMIEPTSTAGDSSILLVDWARLGTDALDTYSGDLGILFFDLHYQSTIRGSVEEIPDYA